MRGASKSPAPRPQPTSAAKPAAVARQAYERPVVLVVDDDDGVREALHLILDDDYVVLDVGDGRTALSIIRAQPVDLVLLDILMPEVDGIEILQELRTFAPTLPVIMMTAVKTVLTAVSAMKLGAHDYITKPFQDASLLASIRTALEAVPARGPWLATAVSRAQRAGRPAPIASWSWRVISAGAQPWPSPWGSSRAWRPRRRSTRR